LNQYEPFSPEASILSAALPIALFVDFAFMARPGCVRRGSHSLAQK
jgi:hypothetical protein